MKKLVLISMLVVSMVSCNKEDKGLMKYAYITQDEVDYSKEKGYDVVSTHLVPVESGSDITQEQLKQRVVTQSSLGKTILIDTLVGINEDVTKILYTKLRRN
jgi:acetone carboxylase gamma subunit